MTKEELEKEAEEYADWFWGASPSMMKALARAYIKGAEPREKEIKSLGERCLQLQKDKGILTDELTKAKEIIKDFILVAKVEHLKDRYETVNEAEQFLKESEK